MKYKMDKSKIGIYNKYTVLRTDGTDCHGGKHENCDLFVLDLTHDPFAIPALVAYANVCEPLYPVLSSELKEKANAISPKELSLDGRSHEWRPIETAPKNTVVVVSYYAWNDPTKPRQYCEAIYDTDSEEWRCTDYTSDVDEIHPPTHWMPLPQTAKEVGNE